MKARSISFCPPPFSLWFLALCGLAAAGCSTAPHSPWHESGGPPDDLRAVRVLPTAERLPLGYRLPSTAGEASSRLAVGGFDVLGVKGGAVVLPLAVGGGAMVGWLRGVSEETTRKAEATIAQAWEGLDPDRGLARELCRLGARRRAGEWIVMEPGEVSRSAGPGVARDGEYWLVLRPVVVVLDTEEAENAVNPRLTLVMRMACSVKRAADGRELACLRRSHRGPSHTFIAWSQNGGGRLTEAVGCGQQKLAEELMAELFAW